MPLVADIAAMLQQEADLLAASQGNSRLLGYQTVSAGDVSIDVDRVKLSVWCAVVTSAE
jgi:hypothetical protein